MDSIFQLGEGERAAFLQHMMESFGSTYICLWSYSPFPSNCLLFLDGFYNDEKVVQQPTSSSGSVAASLFNAYCGSIFYIDSGWVPGFAFRNKVGYLEMTIDNLQTIASSEVQLQFYKTVVFMGCSMGEIELGFSTHPHVNLQMQIQSWFPTIPHHQSSQIPEAQFPQFESEDDAMRRADILSVLSSPSPHQNLPPIRHAFTSYNRTPVAAKINHKPCSSFTRILTFFRDLNDKRRYELQIQENQPTASQMHHMIAERRRREKQNKIFQILRSLLPQEYLNSKKDKASVLRSTAVYLSSLRSQMGELKRRNATLETQILTADQIRESRKEYLDLAPSTTQRVNVEIASISPSTSQARFLDLRMSLRSHECKLPDLVARVLRFLKSTRNVSLLSLQSNTTTAESTPLHTLVLRLKAEGEEFDETGFREAVRRVVDDLPH